MVIYVHINVNYLTFSHVGSVTLGCPATLEMHTIHDSSTTTVELIVIQLHVAGVAVKGQDIQQGN